MVDETSEITGNIASASDSTELEGATPVEHEDCAEWPKADIRRNMTILVGYMVIGLMLGVSGYGVVVNPLLVKLKASDPLIGFVNGAAWAAIPGGIFIPYISRRFRIKKWFNWIMATPNWAPIILLGIGVTYPEVFHVSREGLLGFVMIVWLLNYFTTGLTYSVYNEMVSACLPANHMGRMNGLQNSLGNALGIPAALLTSWVLDKHDSIHNIGLVILISSLVGWVSTFVIPFVKERPAPIEASPVPWSRAMLKAIWDDKPFFRMLMINTLAGIVGGGIGSFVPVYGMKEFGMSTGAIMRLGLVGMAATALASAPTGFFMDRFGAKRVLPLAALAGVVSGLCLVLIHSKWGVYCAVGLGGFFGAMILTSTATLFFILPKPENRLGHFAIQSQMLFVTMSLGPIISGQVLRHIPYRTLFMAGIAFALLMYPLWRWAVALVPDHTKPRVVAKGS